MNTLQATTYGLTGPLARGSGIAWDLRVKRPYMAYREVPVQMQVRQEGDCFARNMVWIQDLLSLNQNIYLAVQASGAGSHVVQ